MIQLLLLIPLVSLWLHSHQHLMAIIACVLLAILNRRANPFALRKLWMYWALIPFAIWWFLAPSGAIIHGIPALLFYLAGWYCWTLAWLQAATLGRGGSIHFVWWNCGAALLLSGIEAIPPFYALSALFFILLVRSFRSDRNPRTSLWPSLLIITFAGSLFVVTSQWLRQHARASGDFNSGRQMRGFNPISFLGTFAEEYTSPYESEIVLRVYTPRAPTYMRGTVYAHYHSGHWRLDESVRWLHPTGQKVEFSIFGDTSHSSPSWVIPNGTTFGYLMHPLESSGFAAVADSLGQSSGGAIKVEDEAARRGWFFWQGPPIKEPGSKEYWLTIPPRIRPLLASATRLSGLDTAKDVPERLMTLLSWYAREFHYSAKPPPPGLREPLEIFMESRRGYCEYFASLATLLLRHQGIPARYVAGFFGPDLVAEGSWAYRRRHAHAWVEYFHEGRWHLLDPTPPAAFPPNTPPGLFSRWFEKQEARLDLALHRLRDGEWKRSLDKIQERTSTLITSPFFWIALLLAGAAGIGIRRWHYRLLRKRPTEWHSQMWARKLEKAERVLARLGVVRARGETVGQFIVRLGRFEKTSAAEVLRQYQLERFRRPTEETSASTSISDRQFKPPGASPV